MKTHKEIWLVGGYGDVGQKTAAHLIAASDLSVVVAGRNRQKAQRVANILGSRARAVVIDVVKPDASSCFPAGSVVVNFVDNAPASFCQSTVVNGGIYLDISASPQYLKSLEDKLVASEPTGLAVLSVGVAPGLTNILAAALVDRDPKTEQIDICIEMGLGRHHGRSATEWFLRNLSEFYPYFEDGIMREAKTGRVHRRFRFEKNSPPILGIGFGFSDQVSIARRLGIGSVHSFVALDPPWVTGMVSGLISSGLGGLISRNAGKICRLMEMAPLFGKVRTRLLLEGRNSDRDPPSRWVVIAGDQSDLTAIITGETLKAALNSRKSGVVHSEDVIDARRILYALHQYSPTIRSWFENATDKLKCS